MSAKPQQIGYNKYNNSINRGANFGPAGKILDWKKMTPSQIGRYPVDPTMMQFYNLFKKNPVLYSQYGQIVDQFYRGKGQYAGQFDPFNFRDTQFEIHPREIERIDRIMARVLRAVPLAARMFRTLFVGKGRKVYKHNENVDGLDPVMTLDFDTYEPGHEEFKEFEKRLLAVSKDYMIGQVAWDASRLTNYLPTSILERTIAEFTAMVADFRERIIFRGGDILTNNTGNTNPDARVKGIVTDSVNVDTVPITATTVAGSLTSVGDFADALVQMAAPLIKANYPSPYKVICGAGVIIQSMKNRNATSDRTDLKNVNELGEEKFGIKIVDEIRWTPHLLKVAESNTNQKIFMYAPTDQAGRANIVIAESYPLWHRPLNLGTTIGVAGKIGWFGGGIVRRQGCAKISDDLIVDVF